jgi:glycosyltransferase involved in cell wall biosynthesis
MPVPTSRRRISSRFVCRSTALPHPPACGNRRLPADARIRYVHLARRLSIGAKRNRACELAEGAIIAHWDDDDWYAPARLSTQVAPLLSDSADITAFTGTRFFDVDRWEIWSCTPELHRRLFVLDVHGGTLVYRRRLFGQLARYPDTSLAEDADFLRAATARRARLHAIPANDLFLYVRHGANTWAFACGRYLDPRGWRRVTEPPALAADHPFYTARTASAGKPRRPSG